MLYGTLSQWKQFVLLAAAGVVAGAWYMLTAVFRRAIADGRIGAAAFDLLFGAGLGAILTAALVAANWGEVRLFHLIAAGAGFSACLVAVYFPLIAAKRRILARLAGRYGKLSKACRNFVPFRGRKEDGDGEIT